MENGKQPTLLHFFNKVKRKHDDANSNTKEIIHKSVSNCTEGSLNGVSAAKKMCGSKLTEKTFSCSTNKNINQTGSSVVKSKLPEGSSEWLKKSVERWNLQHPYSVHTDELWKQYYQERAALEWRHESVWLEDGEEVGKEKSRFYDKEKMQNQWDHDWPMPNLKPHCAESYAMDVGTTTKEQYMKYLMFIRQGVQITLESCKTLPPAHVRATCAGIFILQYWVNFEECHAKSRVRTCHFETRIYSPIGTGENFDIHFRSHHRGRSYSDLYASERNIEYANPADPTPVGEWYPTMCGRSKELNNSMIKLMDQDHKKVTRLGSNKELKFIVEKLFGNENKISVRKAWFLMAKAGGLCAAGESSSRHFEKARSKFGKLLKGEEEEKKQRVKR